MIFLKISGETKLLKHLKKNNSSNQSLRKSGVETLTGWWILMMVGETLLTDKQWRPLLSTQITTEFKPRRQFLQRDGSRMEFLLQQQQNSINSQMAQNRLEE